MKTKIIVWLLLSVCFPSVAFALINNNLVECYALNDYNDSSNYTINLSIIGEGEIINYITDTDCKINNCSVNSIYGGLCSDYNLGVLGRREGNINNSMFGWVKIKPDYLELPNTLFFQGSFESSDTYIYLSYDSDYKKIFVYSGEYSYIEYAITLNVSQWYYIGWVYYSDNTTIELWIDGSKVSETNIGGLNLDFHNAYSGSCIGVGTYGSEGGDFVFDEVAYFERSLNESEITELYNSSNGFGCIDLVNLEDEEGGNYTYTPSPVFYCNLDFTIGQGIILFLFQFFIIAIMIYAEITYNVSLIMVSALFIIIYGLLFLAQCDTISMLIMIVGLLVGFRGVNILLVARSRF